MPTGTKTKQLNITKSMFDDIRQSLEDQSSKNNTGSFKDILKTEMGKVYLVRLLPYVKNPKNTSVIRMRGYF